MAALLLVAAGSVDAAAQDESAARGAKKPSSEADAQKAVAAYVATWLRDPSPATYTFRPLAPGAVSLGFNIKEIGWFMCGTVEQKAAPPPNDNPRMFFVHFDPDQPEIVDGAVDFPTGAGIVGTWCADVYR